MTLLAIRYNNPGNVSLPITGWTGGGSIVGAPGQAGYAQFPTMAIGYSAFLLRLQDYIRSGRNTIRLIGAVYATDPHWPVAVASISGLGIDTPLSPTDAGQMDKLAAAIIRQETGLTLAQLEAQAHPIPEPVAPSISRGTVAQLLTLGSWFSILTGHPAASAAIHSDPNLAIEITTLIALAGTVWGIAEHVLAAYTAKVKV